MFGWSGLGSGREAWLQHRIHVEFLRGRVVKRAIADIIVGLLLTGGGVACIAYRSRVMRFARHGQRRYLGDWTRSLQRSRTTLGIVMAGTVMIVAGMCALVAGVILCL